MLDGQYDHLGADIDPPVEIDDVLIEVASEMSFYAKFAHCGLRIRAAQLTELDARQPACAYASERGDGERLLTLDSALPHYSSSGNS